MFPNIEIRGARLHNLKNISLTIPKNKLVVLTGVSGSGKSTLGLDLLHNECQRQYMEALGFLPFGLARPPVDAIEGLSPSICVDQHSTNRSPRSTVGTVTDVYTYLRVLFARIGRRPCPNCGKVLPSLFGSPNSDWVGDLVENDPGEAAAERYPCPQCGASIPMLSMACFSFNKPAGACPTCTGLGYLHRADISRLVDEQKSILEGAVKGWIAFHIDYYSKILAAAASYYDLDFDISRTIREYSPELKNLLYYGVDSPEFQRHFPAKKPPATVGAGRFEGIATNLLRRYAARIEDGAYREKIEELLLTQVCPDCLGTRLRPASRAVTVDGQSIVDLARLPMRDLQTWTENLSSALDPGEKDVAAPILDEVATRIANLINAGADYLSMERATPSLSAGEVQRLRLASLLGSSLTGVLYIFDEPTIGTHQRDTRRLIGLLRRLRDLGNTVLVIEHDLEVIASADYVIDVGPGGGKHGGQVIATGTPAEIACSLASVTGAYLSGQKSTPVPAMRRLWRGNAITIKGARHHNLHNLNVELPLGLLLAVTAVAGSGKSSLIFDVLARAASQRLSGSGEAPGDHASIEGLENLKRVITIDQQHAGRVPRSNTATYAEIFTPIREAFAATPEAHQRGFSARFFSFNTPGGRCERCTGTGILPMQMHFLPDVEVPCPSCQGKRFTRPVLAVRYRGYDISQVLDLTIDEALALFRDVPAALSRLQFLSDVGLGYLQLGQPATTLSGGEIQRVKLAKELGRRTRGQTLYLLDEPTTGMHLEDISRLLVVLQRLVDSGNTVVVVEHNLHVIRAADWIIDLGPEGGSAGGKLIAQGTPEQVAHIAASYTGQYLREIMT